MSQPEIDGPEVPDRESLAFEVATVSIVLAGVADVVAGALASMVATYARAVALAGGKLSEEAGNSLGRAVAARLRSLRWPAMRPRFQDRATAALALGIERAARSLDNPVIPPIPIGNSRDPLGNVPDIDANLRQALTRAARLAERVPLNTRTNVNAVAGRASGGLAQARGAARWTANEGINAGTAEVARANGLRLIWVAERGACLHCLAHAGYVVEPGSPFPEGLTFDPLASGIPGVLWPPLHPNCRCQVRTYDGPPGPPGGNRSLIDPAARLAAEARRTVAYQWTDHASGRRARLAASALLRAGAGLPVSVERRAAIAVRTGRLVRRPR